MRRAVCRSVPITCSPPAACASLLSLMSVPRPAMLVAIVTLPTVSPCAFLCCCPALATICASRSCCLALSTSCSTPYFRFSIVESISLFSTLVVPTSTGRPLSLSSLISSMIASHFSFSVR